MVRSAASCTLIAAVLFACRAPSQRTSEEGPHPDDTPDSERAQPPSAPQREDATPTRSAESSSTATSPTVLTEEHLEVAGASRSFLLAAPRSYSSDRSYPLVLVLHGDGGNGPSMRAGFPFDDVSGGDAFVAYPTGTEGWNLYEPATDNLDLVFLAALVDDLKARFSIDAAHVFGTGFSSGAFMVNQMACRRPGFFRAIVPQSGGAPNEPKDWTAGTWDNGFTRCENQTRGGGPAVMVIHGTSDGVVTLDSGDFTASYWSYVNACGPSRTATKPAPCQQQDGCPSGHPVLYCAIADLGHTIWTDARATIWHFFRSL